MGNLKILGIRQGGGTMARYITKRLLALVPVLLIVAVIVFVLMRLLPGNPAAMMLGPEATTEEIEQLAEQMG